MLEASDIICVEILNVPDVCVNMLKVFDIIWVKIQTFPDVFVNMLDIYLMCSNLLKATDENIFT